MNKLARSLHSSHFLANFIGDGTGGYFSCHGNKVAPKLKEHFTDEIKIEEVKCIDKLNKPYCSAVLFKNIEQASINML